jgi:hypothetical protein
MPTTTTIGTLPYPLPTDPVANGAGDIEALAKTLDPKLNHVFATTAERDAKWPAAPIGARCFTENPAVFWIKQSTAGWIPQSSAYSGANVSMGSLPAGAYDWPATDTNIAGYDVGNWFAYSGGLTRFAGLYTVTCILTALPGDANDVSIRLLFGALPFVNTIKLPYTVASLTAQQPMATGQEIKWRMYKHPATINWSSVSVRFVMSFQPA